MLSYYPFILLLCFSAILLLCCHAIRLLMLFCYRAVMLVCYYAIIILCHHARACYYVSWYHAIMLSWYYAIMLCCIQSISEPMLLCGAWIKPFAFCDAPLADSTHGKCAGHRVPVRMQIATGRWQKSGHPESNQGPSDSCNTLQSDALPTEL